MTVSEPPAAALDTRLTLLFRHYIDNLAPWYDLNDAEKTFQIVIPQRALSNKILFKALIAFSACHLSKTTNSFQQYSSLYHTSCVEDLLTALNDTSLELQEEYLAATCLLRSYEILNGTNLTLSQQDDTNSLEGDMRKHQDHLLGAYSFATNKPIDLSIHGLAQAGTWNYLREEITVALESRRQVRFSTGFHFVPGSDMPDDQCANAITFILARIINFYFSNTTNVDQEDRRRGWLELSTEVNLWRRGLPMTFQPFSYAPKAGNVFPSIWLLQPWHGIFLPLI